MLRRRDSPLLREVLAHDRADAAHALDLDPVERRPGAHALDRDPTGDRAVTLEGQPGRQIDVRRRGDGGEDAPGALPRNLDPVEGVVGGPAMAAVTSARGRAGAPGGAGRRDD